MSQTDKILNALESGKKLTPIDALEDFGCFRLGARIHELKKEGYPIKTELTKENGKYFATYSMQKVA